MDDFTELPATPPAGVLRVERRTYRGKHYQVPILDPADPVILRPRPEHAVALDPPDSLVVSTIDTVWDLATFLRPRRPVSLGVLSADELATFTRPVEASKYWIWLPGISVGRYACSAR